MIFVTVGTTSFDSLIEEIDSLALKENWSDQVVCQIGSGSYIPQNCEYFRFKSSIESYLEQSDMVITHGGSTVMNLMLLGKPFVAVANTDLADNHQQKVLSKIGSVKDIFWTDKVSDLSELIQQSRSASKKPHSREAFNAMVNDLSSYLES